MNSSLQLYEGQWQRDFDKKSVTEIIKELFEGLFIEEDNLCNVKNDLRVRWCSDVWGGLKNMEVLELGPGDGYHT